MGTKVTCFWVDPGDTAQETLRRYGASDSPPCPGIMGYHNAVVVLGDVPWHEMFHGRGIDVTAAVRGDTRWPKFCTACGYAFRDEDTWQYNVLQYFVDQVTGEKYLLSDGPAGMMFRADWMENIGNGMYKGPDGIALCVRVPGGHDWLIDGPSNSGNGWTREGTPPVITARPSILFDEVKDKEGRIVSSGYHGFLTNGVLEEC